MKHTGQKLVQAMAGIVFVLLFGCGTFHAQETQKNDAGGASSEGVCKVGRDVTPPKAVYNPVPEFTDGARRKKIQGIVILDLIVNSDGTVRDVKVAKSLEPGLDRQAIATVGKWRFQPATKDGKPAAVKISVETSFHLY
jgi:TonB family protein